MSSCLSSKHFPTELSPQPGKQTLIHYIIVSLFLCPLKSSFGLSDVSRGDTRTQSQASAAGIGVSPSSAFILVTNSAWLEALIGRWDIEDRQGCLRVMG